jgi:membrane fusion protein (multidrug efflux system)
MNKKKALIILGFLLLVGCVIAVFTVLNHGIEKTDDATIEAHIIPISAKVPGYIANLAIKDNQHVKKGDLLVEINKRDYELKRDSSKAKLDAAQAAYEGASINAKRQVAIGQAAGTQKDIDNALAAEVYAKANMEAAAADLALAEQNLADAQITAPEDGIITMRTAEQGAYVNVGQQLFMLVGTERWITANFKEVQITDMRPGNKVDIDVDAYPDLNLKGHIDSFQHGTGARFSPFPPENATGNFVKIVQRIPVKILIDTTIPDNVVLGPGLSVIPTVHVGK